MFKLKRKYSWKWRRK